MSNNSYYNDAWRIINEKNQSLVSNYSMEFDGTSDFVDVSVASSDVVPSSQSSWTYSSWLYLDSAHTGNFNCIFKRGQTYPGAGMIVREGSGGKVQVYVNGVPALVYFTVNLIPADVWSHFALVYDISTNELTCYINNSSQTLTMPVGWTISGTIFYIGKRPNNSDHWEGKVDQVSVFDYALPATGTNSIATLYGGGTAVTNPMALSPKPVAYYQLGDQSVYNGANYLVPNNSLQDYVFDFDGSNDYINFINGSTMARGQEITYSVWANLDTFSADIIGNKSSSNFGTGLNFAAGNLVFQLGNGSNDSWNNSRINLSSYVNTGEWFHIIGTFDGTNAKIYINGIERNNWTPTQPFTISGWNNNFQIGKRADQVSSFINGRLSNVAFWNSGLTPIQVTTLYNNGSPAADISSLSPVSWWKLNAADTFDGTNWTINDYAGSNDGTSSGMTSANLVQSNLQHTSGYSPYAITLDGTGEVFNLDSEILLPDNKTVSFWFKLRVVPTGQFAIPLSSSNNRYYPLLQNNGGNFQVYIQGANGAIIVNTFLPIAADVWYNFIITGDGTTPLLYINGTQYTFGSGTDRTDVLIGDIGARPNGSFDLDGDMSNVAIWSGTTLSSTEVTEVYNQGVPSNLNTFSGTKPTAWWQLGSNSSFNATTSQWTCLDEIGTNNAVSLTNMANDDITNGVGYSANGLGTSSIEIIGDAPYSTANGISENMDVLDRTTDVPS